MLDHTPSVARLIGKGQSLRMDIRQRLADMRRVRELALSAMVDAVDAVDARADSADTRVRNAQAPWNDFASEKYYDHNYKVMQAEDQEIIHRVSLFLADAFAGRERAECAIDVGSGANLYPALLMLPWTNHILLTDFSQSNVSWLGREVGEESSPWAWESFWQELKGRQGYDHIDKPRQLLKKACCGNPERAGIRRYSVFDLPAAQWQLGTMFFVAESITEDLAEFRTAIGKFVAALKDGAPFAATFMAESAGYEVGDTWFPASQVTSEQVAECFEKFGVTELTVEMTETPARVREGYNGMIMATGIAGGR